MKNKKFFETVGEAGQIFAIGFDLINREDKTQDAEIRSYIEFNDITTNDAMKVIGDVLGKFIHGATKKEKTRHAMLKTLIAHVVESMDSDEPEPKQEAEPEPKQEEPEGGNIQKIADTLASIKSLLEVIKIVKED